MGYNAADGVTGDYNVSVGSFAGYGLTSATKNVFVGYTSGRFTTTGNYNTFLGSTSGYTNTTGYQNVFLGRQAGYNNLSGANNVFVGEECGVTNSTGSWNTFVGENSGYSATGSYNTLMGALSGNAISTGQYNTLIGEQAGRNTTTADNNVAIGSQALFYNTTGASNIAVGNLSLQNNTATGNTAIGDESLGSNTSGTYNAGIGSGVLAYNTTGSYNSAIGYTAGPNTNNISNTTALGNGATTTASNQVRVGNSSVTSIGGPVGWSTISDGRFKKDIKEDISGLNFINALRPVSYVVDKNAFDRFIGVSEEEIQKRTAERKSTSRENGFIAQEVEALVKKSGYVFHGVEAPQNDKDHYSIRYAEFVVPLVKAVQELSGKLQDQNKVIEEQQKKIDLLLTRLDQKNNPAGSTESEIILFQNVPNPFSIDTEIKMQLPGTTQRADLIIYNLEGVQLKSVAITNRGNVTVKVSANELKAGMYIYALIADNKVVDSKRMILTN